jgi:hypothetical protein
MDVSCKYILLCVNIVFFPLLFDYMISIIDSYSCCVSAENNEFNYYYYYYYYFH